MESTSILVLGANGMLGHKLFFYLSSYANLNVHATVRSLNSLSAYCSPQLLENVISHVQAADISSVTRAINQSNPDMIINCIGIVRQGPYAEDIPANITVNALFPHQLAEICRKRCINLLHISTDCVFSGAKGDYSEDDVPDAGDLYGRCKLLGEPHGLNVLTLRTSIIGHEINTQYGLLEWFLAQQENIRGFTRHIFSGFPTIELARIIAAFIIPNKHITGIYHLSSSPITKHDLLKLVAFKYDNKIPIEPDAATSCDRSLNSDRLRTLIGFTPLPWPEMIDSMHEDYLGSSCYIR